MNQSINSEEIALVTLLDDEDNFIQEKVKDAITKKGLYGIRLLNSQDIHFSSSDEDELATDIFYDILVNEIKSVGERMISLKGVKQGRVNLISGQD